MEFADGAVALTAGGDDEGRAEEQLEVAYEGEPITTAFNPQFLLDGLGALATGTARMLFTSSTKPVVLRPEASRRRRVHVPDHAGAAARLSYRRMYVRHLSVADFRSWAERRRRLRARAVGADRRRTGRARRTWSRRSATSPRSAATGSPPTRRWSGPAPSGRSCGRRSWPTAASCASRSRSRRAGPTGRSSTAPRCPARATSSACCASVLFAPEDLAIVRGDPSERRRFLDELVVARAPADGRRARRLRAGAQAARGAAEVGRRGPRGGGDLQHARRLGRPPGRARRAAAAGPAGRGARRCARTPPRPTPRWRRPARR